MTDPPRQITLAQWDSRYERLLGGGLREGPYGGPLRRHLEDGDLRLAKLSYDNSPAALRLWNFLLSEEDRLRAAAAAGRRIVGAMKDLGTIPVMAYSLPDMVAFYPDGAWWIPCVMELSAGLLGIADSLGIDESFCPVRAMLGAFVTEAHFPLPDLLTCSAGATCDDFSVIAQRLEGLGHPILWWEMPHRRTPRAGEPSVALPGDLAAPRDQVSFVRSELARVREALENLAGTELSDDLLAAGIRAANRVRRTLRQLRRETFTARVCPMGALEMLVAEMLAIHFCSDRDECQAVLDDLLAEVRRRVKAGRGVLAADAVRVFWVNPVADLRAMNFLEAAGGRICGTEYMFSHALDEIPEDVDPLAALSRTALSDPMVGPAGDRARRICRDAKTFGAEAVLISRMPGASHCAWEGRIIGDMIQSELSVPVLEIEVPPVADAVSAKLRNRLDALLETARARRP